MIFSQLPTGKVFTDVRARRLDEPGFDDAQWQPVQWAREFQPAVESHPGPPVVAIKEFKAKSITEPSPGVYVLDLGRNFAGVARLRVQESAGKKVTLRFAERLNPDGSVDVTNLRGACATDSYTCRGEGVETWQPRFTFHGFQYVEVSGLSSPPTEGHGHGVARRAATPPAGGLSSAPNAML